MYEHYTPSGQDASATRAACPSRVAESPAPRVFRRVDTDPAAAITLPPACITGVSNTMAPCGPEELDDPVSMMVDWLRVTFPFSADALDRAKFIFGPGLDWEQMDYGRWTYKQCLRRGDVSILYDGNGGTVCVDVTGKGCRQIEAEGVLDVPAPELGVVGGWQGLFGDLLAAGCSFPRVDWAFDDREQLLNVEAVSMAVKQGRCVTRFRRAHPYEEVEPSTGEKLGEGYYFGGRESLMFVRIYNKQLERLAAADEDPGPLMRLEVESKQEKALALVIAFCSLGPAAVAMDLWAMLDFKETPHADDSNRSRWASCEWWVRFLDVASKCRVKLAPAIKTLEGAARAVAEQWGPVIAAVLSVPSYGGAWLRSVVESGMKRWKPRHISMMAAHLSSLDELPQPLREGRYYPPCSDCGKPCRHESPFPGICWPCWASVYWSEGVTA